MLIYLFFAYVLFTKFQGLTLTAVGGANMPVTKIPVTLAEPYVQKNFLTTVLTIVGFLTGSSGWSYSVMCCVRGKDIPLVCPLFCVK